jgi:hypothetical protein
MTHLVVTPCKVSDLLLGLRRIAAARLPALALRLSHKLVLKGGEWETSRMASGK